MSEQFLATAFVAIRPDFKKFPAELKQGLKVATAGVEIEVKVVPVVGNFKKQLVAAIGKIDPIPVPVELDAEQFKKELARLVEDTQKSLGTLKIPIQTVQVGGGAASTAAGTAAIQKSNVEKEKAASVSKVLRDSLIKETQASDLLNKVFGGGLSKKQEQLALSEALRKAESALKPVLLSEIDAQNTLSKAEAKALVQRQRSVEGTIKHVQAELQLAGAGKTVAASTQSLAQTEEQLAFANVKATVSNQAIVRSYEQYAAAQKEASVAAGGTLETTARLEILQDSQKTVTDLLKKSIAQEAVATLSGAEADQKAAAALQEKLLALSGVVSGEIAATQAIVDREVAEQKSATAATLAAAAHENFVKITAIEVSSIKALEDVKADETVTNAALTGTEDALALARESGAAALVDQLVTEEAALTTRLEALKRQKQLIREQIALQKELGVFGRGGAAAGLGAVGARGAVLAASGPFLAGAAAATGLLKATEQAKEFQTQLALIEAATGADEKEIRKVSDAARTLGSDLKLPLTSAIDAERAIADLARSGRTLTQSLKAARGVLQLAAAGDIDVADATKIAVQNLNAFNLSAEHTVDIADALVNATLATQGDIRGLATAMSNVASPAAKLGLSLQDTTALLIQLARGGIRVSDTGVVLRTSLLRLVAPTGKAAKELSHLGISIRDAQGRLRPDAFVRIAEAVKDLSAAARQQALGTIFSQRGIRAGLVFAEQGRQGFRIAQREASRSGRALEEAQKKADTLAGSAQELKKNLVDVGNAITNPLVPSFEALLHTLSSVALVIPKVGGGLADIAKTKPISLVTEPIANNQGAVLSALGSLFLFRTVSSKVTDQNSRLSKSLTGVGARFLYVGESLKKTTNTAGRFGTTLGRTLSAGDFSRSLRVASIGIKGLSASLIGAAAAFDPLTIAAVATGAALFVLLTHESALERTSRRLEEATIDLANALDKQQESADTVSFDKIIVQQDKLTKIEADRAVVVARQALENSGAAKGSAQRAALEFNLAKAIVASKSATLEYNKAVRDLRNEQSKKTALDAQAAAQRKIELQDTNDLIKAQLDQAHAKAKSTQTSTEGRAAIAQAAIAEAVKRTTAELIKQGQEEKTNADVNVQLLGRRKLAIAALQEALGRAATPREVKILFNSPNLGRTLQGIATGLQDAGKVGAAKALLAIVKALGVLPKKVTTPNPFDGLPTQAAEAGRRSGLAFVNAFAAQLSRLQTQMDIAVGSGVGLNGQLAIAQAQLTKANQEFAAAKKLLGKGESPSRRGAFEKAAADRRSAFEQVQSLSEQVNQEAKDKADKIQQDADAANQKMIDAISGKEVPFQRRITLAGQTPGLQDDINRNRQFKRFLQNQIKLLRARLKDKKLSNDAKQAIRSEITTLNGESFDLDQDLKKLFSDQQQRILARFDLRVQLAQANDNVPAEIRAREAKVAQLTKALNRLKRAHKGSTNEALELQVQIAEENKAIAALKGTVDDQNNAFASLSFAFLQAQSGFVANLLGNLIPQGATSGLVGGTDVGSFGPRGVGGTGAGPIPFIPGDHGGPTGPDGKPLPRNVGKDLTTASGTKASGPTRGGQATELHLLRQIHLVLLNLYRGTGHPEAHHRRRTGAASFDGVRGD